MFKDNDVIVKTICLSTKYSEILNKTIILFFLNKCNYLMSQKFQIQNSFSTLEILKVEPSGVGEPIPLWRVKRNDFQNWKIGRLYIESDFDYRVG
jgi:hypothetical protein